MAQDNNPTGVMDAPSSTEGNANNASKPAPLKQSAPSSGPKTYKFGPEGFKVGGQNIVLDYLVAEGRTPQTKERGWVKQSSLVTIAGKLGNLRIFDRAALWVGQTRIPLRGVKFENRQIVFKVPDNIASSISPNGTIAIELGNSMESGILSDFLLFKPESKEEEKKDRQKLGEAGKVGEAGSVGGGFGKGGVGIAVNAAGEILQNTLGKMTGVGMGGKVNKSQPKPVISSQASSSKRTIKEDDYDNEVTVETEAGGEVASEVAGGGVVSGSQQVSVSGEVTATTSQSTSGTVTQTTQVTGQTGGSVTGSAATTTQTTVTAQGQRAGGGGAKVEITGQARQGGGGAASVSVTGGVRGAVQATTEGAVGTSATATAIGITPSGGAGSLSLQQSMEIVGNHLENNPRSIANQEIRNQVTTALRSGNLQGLDIEGRTALRNTLRMQTPEGQPGAARLQAAMQNVSAAMASPAAAPAAVKTAGETVGATSATITTPAGARPTGQASGNVAKPEKAEQGLQAAKEAGADLSGTGQQAENPPAKPVGATAQPPVEPLESSSNQPAASQEGASAEASAVGQKKPPTPEQKEAGELAQKVDGIKTPEEFEKMRAALTAADKAREDQLGLKGGPQSKAGGGKEGTVPPGKLPNAPATGKTSEKTSPEGKSGGSKVKEGSPDEAKKPGAPEMPAPINPDQLAQTPEAQAPGKAGEEGEPGAEGEEEGEEENPEEQEIGPAVPSVRPRKQPWETASQTKRILEKSKLVGRASSKIWYYGFGSASATLFSGLDFFAGAIIMDAYWFFGHRKDKKLFPLSPWKKFITVFANVAPFLYLAVFSIILIYAGCNYPTKVGNYKLSFMGMAGYSDLCQTVGDITENIFSGIGGLAPISNLPPAGGICSPAVSGPASVANLQATCFGYNAPYASAIAYAESGGIDTSLSKVDICTGDNSVVSIGLFQINISANPIRTIDGQRSDGSYIYSTYLNCPQAFDHAYTGSNRNCHVVNQNLYNQCVAAAKNAAYNITTGCYIAQIKSSQTTAVWNAWSTNRYCSSSK